MCSHWFLFTVSIMSVDNLSELDAYRQRLAEISVKLEAAKDDEEIGELETEKADLFELINLMESEQGEEGLAIIKPDEEPDPEEEATCIEDDLADLIGMRCRAPFSGGAPFGLEKHAAIVLDIEGLDPEKGVMLSVLYSHPIIASMRPCPHFMADVCRFGEKCKFSHGNTVPASQLEDYEEPDFTSVTEGSPVLVSVDPLWEVGRVTAKDGDTLAVKILRTGAEVSSSVDRIIPIDGEIEVEEVPIEASGQYAELKGDKCGNVSTSDLGNWEGGGIGLKIMQRMGYKKGEGLGKKSDGIVHAIQARICPKGASLDALMEKKGRKKVVDGMAAKLKEVKPKSGVEQDIFSFLNKRLTTAQMKDEAAEQEKERKQLSESSQAGLGLQSIDTERKMKELRSKEQKLIDGLKRNAKDKETMHKLNLQLTIVKRDIEKLVGKKGRIVQEMEHRSQKKKDIF